MALLLQGVVALMMITLSSPSPPPQEEPQLVVSRIAFGSCANQSAPQPIWEAIIDFKPDVFIWMGDNIYGDLKRPFKVFGKERTIGPWKNTERFYPASIDQMKSNYLIAKSNPSYNRLLHNTPKPKIIGTWDDHDYGLNDAGKEFTNKVPNQKLLLDFLDEPIDSPRRKQDGVYTSYIFGPMGKQIKVILLDTRYHRDPISSDGDVLGSTQWKWLEKELNNQHTSITIIGSSYQVISNLSATTGPLFYTESWGRFPKERARLFKLISDSKREGVFFISGDVHYGEITRYDCATEYPLYDITSSGLTQAVEKVVPSSLHFIVRFLAWLTPTTMRVMDKSCRHKSCTYAQPNFGTVEINWDMKPVNIKFEVKDVKGESVISLNMSLSHLQVKGEKENNEKRQCTLEVDLPWIKRYRLAILVFFAMAVLLLLLAGFIFGIVYFVITLHKCKRD